MENGTRIVAWRAPDHNLPERAADWYASVMVIGVAIASASYLLDNLLFAIFCLLATISIIIHMAKKPELIDFALTTQGVEVRHDFFPYDTLHSFWIDNSKNKNEMILHSDRKILPHLIIPLGGAEPNYLRDILLQHIPEKYAHKNLIDKALDYLGF